MNISFQLLISALTIYAVLTVHVLRFGLKLPLNRIFIVDFGLCFDISYPG